MNSNPGIKITFSYSIPLSNPMLHFFHSSHRHDQEWGAEKKFELRNLEYFFFSLSCVSEKKNNNLHSINPFLFPLFSPLSPLSLFSPLSPSPLLSPSLPLSLSFSLPFLLSPSPLPPSLSNILAYLDKKTGESKN